MFDYFLDSGTHFLILVLQSAQQVVTMLIELRVVEWHLIDALFGQQTHYELQLQEEGIIEYKTNYPMLVDC